MAKSSRKVEYDDGSTDDAKRKSRGAVSLPQGLSVFKPRKSGTMRLNIIPFWVTENRERYTEQLRRSKKAGLLFPHRIFWLHYGIGVNNEPFVCLSKTFGKKCPICEEQKKYLEKPDNESKKTAQQLKPKERQLWLVQDADEVHKGIQLWEVSIHNFGVHLVDYLEGFRNPKDKQKHANYYRIADGLVINVNCKEESAGDRAYTDFQVHSMSDREDALEEEILDHGYDLDAMVVEETYDRLKRIYHGEDFEEEADDDGDDDSEVEDKPASPLPVKQSPPPTTSSNGHRNAPLASEKVKSRLAEEQKAKESPRDDGKPYIFATGDKATIEWKGEVTEVMVVSSDLDAKTCMLRIPGRDKPMQFPWEDMTLVEADSTFDLKKTAGWEDENAGSKDDEDADPVPPSKSGKKGK